MKGKFHYGKRKYILTFAALVFVLFIIRILCPSLLHPVKEETETTAQKWEKPDSIAAQALVSDSLLKAPIRIPQDLSLNPTGKRHRILSVRSFDIEFCDLNDEQIITAQRLGFPAVQDREAASHADYHHLVYIGNSPFYFVKKLKCSIPFLTPKAQLLLNHISRSFIDSLMVKNIKPSKLIVTSLTRTREDVAQLRKHNSNATENSCHCYGTTFDISYTKYHPIADPDGIAGRQTRDDTLKWVLSEVLKEHRDQGMCYIKHEKKQGCFHITVR